MTHFGGIRFLLFPLLAFTKTRCDAMGFSGNSGGVMDQRDVSGSARGIKLTCPLLFFFYLNCCVAFSTWFHCFLAGDLFWHERYQLV
jgi:hypothetical protein